jgi:hypothetical protein
MLPSFSEHEYEFSMFLGDVLVFLLRSYMADYLVTASFAAVRSGVSTCLQSQEMCY